MEKLVSTAILSLLIILPSFAATVKIDHYMGTTEVEQSPKRVVVIGFGPLDMLDSFGIDPVAVSNAPIFQSTYLNTARPITHRQVVFSNQTLKPSTCKSRT